MASFIEKIIWINIDWPPVRLKNQTLISDDFLLRMRF
jgi:hypothetical protein